MADFILGLHAGYSFGSFFDDPNAVRLGEYTDYSLKFSRNIVGFDVSLAYLDTDIDKPYAIDDDFLANQETWKLSFTTSL